MRWTGRSKIRNSEIEEATSIAIDVGNNEFKGDIFVDLSLHSKPDAEHCIPRCMIDTKINLIFVVNSMDESKTIKKG